VADRVAVARKALAAWSAEATFETELEALANAVLAKEIGRPLGDVLAELGLKDVARTKATELVRRRIASFVAGDAFAEWVAGVLA
jgi:hypothetical protein